MILLECLRGFFFRLLYFGMQNTQKLRVGHHFQVRGQCKIGQKVYIASNVKVGVNVSIGDKVYIGDNVELRSPSVSCISIGDETTINRNTVIMGKVFIGKKCSIANNSSIIGSNHVFSDVKVSIKSQGMDRKGIQIGNDVWIGANVVVLDGISIGDGCVVGAGAVVTKSVPPCSIVVGNPGRIIKNRCDGVENKNC